MSDHVHLVIERRSVALEDILLNLKKHTSRSILKAVEENPQESRKEWMFWLFERAGKNGNNTKYQFWEQHNQPIELTVKAFAINSAIDYIHNNPVKVGFVYRSEDYPYISVVDFAGEKEMVDIEPC